MAKTGPFLAPTGVLLVTVVYPILRIRDSYSYSSYSSPLLLLRHRKVPIMALARVMVLTRIMALTCVMVFTRVIALTCVMVLTRVIVLNGVIVLTRIMV